MIFNSNAELGDTFIFDEGAFTLAELQTEYQSWLEKNALTLRSRRPPIPLKDFRTGLSVEPKCQNVLFQLKELFKTKIVSENKTDTKMKVSKEAKRLGDFKDALED